MQQITCVDHADTWAERWEREIKRDAWCEKLGCGLNCPPEIEPLSRDCAFAEEERNED